MDFGGWDMPIHYGSQISEHLHTRSNVSLFDVSHMAVVDILGKDSHTFLKLLIANNVDKLIEDGQALYTCMLNPEGGIIDDLLVYRFGDYYRLVINASTAVSDLAWMINIATQFSDVHIIPRRSDIQGAQDPIVLLAIQGPKSVEALSTVFPQIAQDLSTIRYFHAKSFITPYGEIYFSRTGYTGEDGFELFIPMEFGLQVWEALLKIGVLPAGLGARDTLRIEAGLNLYGQDMNSIMTPMDSGLSWTVDLSPERSFIGASALRVKLPRYSFFGLVLLGKGVLRAHQKVISTLGDGEMTSGTFSPSLQKSIGFARLPIGVQLGDEVKVCIRDQEILAKIVKTTFVRKGKQLI